MCVCVCAVFNKYMLVVYAAISKDLAITFTFFNYHLLTMIRQVKKKRHKRYVHSILNASSLVMTIAHLNHLL